jgi:hypothetical protein
MLCRRYASCGPCLLRRGGGLILRKSRSYESYDPRSPCFQGIEGREPNAEMAVFEPSTSGGQRAHVKSRGQSVGTAHLDEDPTSDSILLKSSESVSFPVDTIALNVLVGSGKPLTTAVPTSEKERDGIKRNGPDRDRPRRTSIWPKMAVTVGFEPIRPTSTSTWNPGLTRIRSRGCSCSIGGIGFDSIQLLPHRCRDPPLCEARHEFAMGSREALTPSIRTTGWRRATAAVEAVLNSHCIAQYWERTCQESNVGRRSTHSSTAGKQSAGWCGTG